jgi:hypothetical protein
MGSVWMSTACIPTARAQANTGAAAAGVRSYRSMNDNSPLPPRLAATSGRCGALPAARTVSCNYFVFHDADGKVSPPTGIAARR